MNQRDSPDLCITRMRPPSSRAVGAAVIERVSKPYLNRSLNEPSIDRRKFDNRKLFLQCVLAVGLLGGFAPVTGLGQETEDVVIVRREPSGDTMRRRGTIRQWKGHSLTLFANGRERQIVNAEIIEIQTSWPPAYREGLNLVNSGDLPGATKKFQAALATEQRDWARRMVRAELVRLYQASDNHQAATNQFLAIVREDPQTRFFHLCPLPWASGANSVNEQAATLIDSRDAVEQLLGASWLLAGTQRERATKVLDRLSRDIDANIKSLATAQLWRPRIFNANAKLIDVWEKAIDQMPAQIQAGPWYLVAQAQARLGQKNAATTNLMRIPILYPEQLGLSAAALYQAGQMLQNNGQTSEARAIWDELQQKYPSTVWAQQALSQFETADPVRSQ